MKRVMVLLMLIICMPISYAEIINVPEITPGEDVPGPLKGGLGVKKFVYAGSLMVASIGDSEVEYYHQGGMSNRLTSDSNGNKNKEFKSLPFGQKIANSGVDYPFTGKGEDESGLYYFGARYYDDNLGRFTSVDPVEDNHAYSYVTNNPMNLIDPTGMDEEQRQHTIQEGDTFSSLSKEYQFTNIADLWDLNPGILDNVYDLGQIAGSTINIPSTNMDNLKTRAAYSALYAVGRGPDTFIHEASHYLVAELLGVDAYDFHPYPREERTTAGHIRLNGPTSDLEATLIYIAPYLTNYAVTYGWEQLIRNDAIDPYGNLGTNSIWAYYGANHMLGSLSGFYSNSGRGGDISRISEITGINKWALVAVGTAIDAYMVYRVADSFRDKVREGSESPGVSVGVSFSF
jgi:RHS repeat-associated protein